VRASATTCASARSDRSRVPTRTIRDLDRRQRRCGQRIQLTQ
jgi:hypothetical protein